MAFHIKLFSLLIIPLSIFAFVTLPIHKDIYLNSCGHPGSTTKIQSSYLNDLEASSSSSSTAFHDPKSTLPSPSSANRLPIIAGNWKLNPNTMSEATNLLKLLASNFLHHRNTGYPEVVIFPPFPFLGQALEILEGTGIKVGAQNCAVQQGPGAFTGEVSASMIRSMGSDYIMLGHSERRRLFGESDNTINSKLLLCLQQSSLNIILCVGETEEEYDSQLLHSVVDVQLKKGLLGVNADEMVRVVIAYEPVWAIGTGKVATPQQANDAHIAVRRTLQAIFGVETAQKVRIQYGGSVKVDNIYELVGMPEINGALVGGASLTAEGFTRIVDGISDTIPWTPKGFQRELTARQALSTKNLLGESPVWSDRDQSLYWVSAPEEEIWTWNLIDPPYRRLMGTMLGCVALKRGDYGSIVLGGERGILQVTMSPTTNDFASGPSILCDRPDLASMTRPNDGRVDRQGRLVFGMYNNYHRSGASEGANNAGLFRLDGNLEYEKLLNYDFRVSNCICFPQDGETMFFCDTPTRKVYAFDYPMEKGGKLTNRRLIWTVPSDMDGGPDGAQVDSEGFIWIAVSGAGKVVRVDPCTGHVAILVHLPVKSPTSCTFGGPDLDELFITTRGPDGGELYRVKIPFGIRGLPEPEFVVAGEGMSSPLTIASIPNQIPSQSDYTWWNKKS